VSSVLHLGCSKESLEALQNLTYSQKHAFIGFYSKRRKTTMQVIHLGQKELAQRWRMSEATLERWRSDRKGPVFLKILGRVLYRLEDIEAFEVASLKSIFVEHCNGQNSVDSSSLELALASNDTQSPARTSNYLLDV
jgi:DNA-binding Xre family transcriptional regulator